VNDTLRGVRIAILVDDHYEDLEFWYPYYRLQEHGAEVTAVGTGRTMSFTGKHGLPAKADVSVDDIRADDFDGLVIPGGWAPDLMRRKPEMVQFVRDIANAGKPVAAICHAGWMLVSAGILKGRQVTCFFAIKDDMVAAGANYVDEPVVVDGNLITSRLPADLPYFMPAVIGALEKARAAAV
jgi:protease I